MLPIGSLYAARFVGFDDLHDGLTLRSFVRPEVIKIVGRRDSHRTSFYAACDAGWGGCHSALLGKSGEPYTRGQTRKVPIRP